MSSQTIYSELKSGDNKKLWAYAQELDNFRRKASTGDDISDIDFDDPDAVRKDLYKELRKAYQNGNVAGAKELVDLLNIKDKSNQWIIEPVNFADAEW